MGIHTQKMANLLLNTVHSKSKWALHLKRGRTSIEDDPRNGCLKRATVQDIRISYTVLEGRRLCRC